MTLSCEISWEVAFHDVDIMHIVWHGHYFKYFEMARTALMRQMQLDWPSLREAGIAMPVVDVAVQYRRSLRYGEKFWIEARIEEFNYPELRIDYKIRIDGSHETAVSGMTRQVYWDIMGNHSLFEVPEIVQDRMHRSLEAGR
ncbi:MAG: thioesterase family protein [Proteobacteria bacterium]|nr:thioesterase family protein [Pseudomonadota bacterium]